MVQGQFGECETTALAPGSCAFIWPKAPRVTAKPERRDVGQDSYLAQQQKTLKVDVTDSPRRFTASFSSEQLRLSQMRRSCRPELSTPVPWKLDTADVGPGTYEHQPIAPKNHPSSFFLSTTYGFAPLAPAPRSLAQPCRVPPSSQISDRNPACCDTGRS